MLVQSILSAVLSVSIMSAHAGASTMPVVLRGTGPAIGDTMPAPLLATAVRERMPSFREVGVTYVVVFFNSSDAVSRQSLPVLDTLAQRFGKKLVIVAISDEPVSVVRDFAGTPEWAPKLGFVVAADPTRNSLQTVYGQGSWPTLPVAFVVRGGVVQWRGVPLDLDPIVSAVVTDHWDIAAAQRAAEQQRLWDEQMSKVDALAKGARFDEALAALDGSCASAMPAQAALCTGRKFSLLISARRIPEALTVGAEIMRAPANEKQAAGIAWTIVNVIPGDADALAFALKAAQSSDRALKGRDPMVGAILARVLWLSGRRTEAIETARRALSLADSPDLQNSLREDLRVYEPASKPKAPAR